MHYYEELEARRMAREAAKKARKEAIAAKKAAFEKAKADKKAAQEKALAEKKARQATEKRLRKAAEEAKKKAKAEKAKKAKAAKAAKARKAKKAVVKPVEPKVVAPKYKVVVFLNSTNNLWYWELLDVNGNLVADSCGVGFISEAAAKSGATIVLDIARTMVEFRTGAVEVTLPPPAPVRVMLPVEVPEPKPRPHLKMISPANGVSVSKFVVVEFTTDNDDAILSMVLHMNGMHHIGQKLHTGPWKFEIETREYENGDYDIHAFAEVRGNLDAFSPQYTLKFVN
jgi:hypothetical protein